MMPMAAGSVPATATTRDTAARLKWRGRRCAGQRWFRYPLQSLYTVHRIPPWTLFFSNKDGQPPRSQAATEIKKAVLPSPIVTLYPSAGDLPMNFVLFGRGKDKIMATDYLGRAFLYDDALGAVSALPSMKDPIYDPAVSTAVGDDVYFVSNPPDASVRALADQTYWSRRSEMYWSYVPPPPYAKKPKDNATTNAAYDGSVQAYTLVGESQLWVSAESCGTYSMDTQKKICYGIEGHEITRGEWSKVGDWVLPFHGRACYAREHNLWFGFSGRDRSILCAADLQQQQQPVLRHEWEGFTVPKANRQASVRSFLVHLGTGGRFCIAQFSTDDSDRDTAMLTGVEVARCADGQALCLVKHKTYCYEGLGDDDNPICLL